ncbi:MAG: ABC transporter ATP-binding protein [Desulfatibacillum sp.]|nr:ABC transporter ATP-binding protein [Desulfatibacillum sp.]
MILEAQNLHVYYGLSHVLQGVDLSLEEGETLCLMGRNGMGKSTTLKALAGVIKPKHGKVTLKGRDITGKQPHQIARAGMGYVPEERRVFPNLTVIDNLTMGAKPPAGDGKNQVLWDVERVFRHFPRLAERCNNKGANLSGGEQQMLAIARALMGNPDVLLVDEPSEGLAPIMVLEVRDILAEINKSGVSVLLVDHNLEMAMSLAHKVCLMGKGRTGYFDTAEALQKHPEILAKYLEV